MYEKNVEEKLDIARRLFKKYDLDNSGALDEKEIYFLIKETYA